MSAPSPNVTLLLRAAAGESPEALVAWQRWRDATDFDRLEKDAGRLVPLLYRNLSRLGVESAATQRYASVYRHCWARNRLVFAAAVRALTHLQAGGVETLLLKGAALSLLYYRDRGVRAMGDVDVLIRPERLADAVAILFANGWVAGTKTAPIVLTPDFIATHHSAGFSDPQGKSIDLHWYASSDACRPGADDAFWKHAVNVDFDGVATLAPDAPELLFVVLAHGFTSFSVHVRWAADALAILGNRGAGFDWERLVALAIRRRMVVPVHAALGWLRAELGAYVPDGVLARLDAASTLVDRLEYEQRMSDTPFAFHKVLLRLWCWHRRMSADEGVALALGFPAYLGRYWGLGSRREVVATAFRRGLERVRKYRCLRADPVRSCPERGDGRGLRG